MSSLTFFPIMTPGAIGIGEGEDAGADVFDRYWPPIPTHDLSTHVGVGKIDLGNVDTSMPAHLQFLTRGVDYTRNFVTWYYPGPYNVFTYLEVVEGLSTTSYAGRILDDQGSRNSWTQQTLIIRPGQLVQGDANMLGIHSRDGNGETKNNRDNFEIANILLCYYLEGGPFVAGLSWELEAVRKLAVRP